MSQTVIFADDEQGYRDWVTQNSLGFVMVSHNPPMPNYTTVHRADCYTINPAGRQDTENWTRQYVKVCAPTMASLEAWSVATWGEGVALHKCGHCTAQGRL